jgi:positive regulator of sigma E activity
MVFSIEDKESKYKIGDSVKVGMPKKDTVFVSIFLFAGGSVLFIAGIVLFYKIMEFSPLISLVLSFCAVGGYSVLLNRFLQAKKTFCRITIFEKGCR